MEKYKSPLCCSANPMFLRTLGAAQRIDSYDRNSNKFAVRTLIRDEKKTKTLPSDKCNLQDASMRAGHTIYKQIQGYHNYIRPNKALESTNGFSFGLELETVAKTIMSHYLISTGQALVSNWIYCARDGSLPTSAGIELATIPLPSQYALSKSLWEDTTKHLRQLLYAAPDFTCGLHVHVGLQYLLPSHPLYDKSNWVRVMKKVSTQCNAALPPAGTLSIEESQYWRLPMLLFKHAWEELRHGDSNTTNAYNRLVYQKNRVGLFNLYKAINEISDLTTLPKVLLKYSTPKNPDRVAYVKSANCTNPGAFLLRCGVPSFTNNSYKTAADTMSFGPLKPSPGYEEFENYGPNRLLRIMSGCSDGSREVLASGVISIAERSYAYGSRLNGLRSQLLPQGNSSSDSAYDLTRHPFYNNLFGRTCTGYCEEATKNHRLFSDGIRFEKLLPHYRLTADDEGVSIQDIMKMDIPTFANYLRKHYPHITEEDNKRKRLGRFARYLTYIIAGWPEISTGKLGPVFMDRTRDIAGAFDFFTTHVAGILPVPDKQAITRCIRLCYCFLYYRSFKATEIEAILDQYADQRDSLEWILAMFSLACSLREPPSISSDHHCELCTTDTTLEFRRGKATLNPNRIHSILTYLYYLSSAVAASPITPYNLVTIAKSTVKACVEQPHSPLLAHYAATCFSPDITGCTADEALFRRAPVLTSN